MIAENSSKSQVQIARQRAVALTPLSMICVLGTLWGASASLAKLAVFDGFSRWDTRCGILLAICAWRSMLPRMKVVHIRYYVICGVLGVAIPNLNVVVVGHIPAGVIAAAFISSGLALVTMKQGRVAVERPSTSFT